ncbi:MAG: PIN domain-containing protein [Dehalococcoidia bacterium]|nr:PIN domain-containing protein [Dehalococcoidia bacterium]
MKKHSEGRLQIVLDTNTIFNNWFLDSPNFKVVERLVKLGVCKLIIPEVIILEVKGKYREELIRRAPAIGHLNTMLPKDRQIGSPGVEELCTSYDVSLRKRLEELEVESPSHGDIAQDEIVARLFGHRRPFSKQKTSDKGYRDALLWEVILRKVLKRDDTTFFITEDINDFSDEHDSGKLHADLLEDLKHCGSPNTSLILCTALGQWVRENGVHYLETAELAEDLKDGECEGFSLRAWFINEREAFIQALDEQVLDIFRGYSIDDPTVSYIEDPESVAVEEALMLNEDTIFLRAKVLAGVSIDGYIEQWDYDPESGRLPIWLVDLDYSKDYVFACLFTDLPLRFSATFGIEKKRITDFELDDVEIWGWCRHCGAVILSDSAESCYKCGRQYP